MLAMREHILSGHNSLIATRAMLRNGELDYTAEEVKDFKPEQTALLTPKRIELLCQLAVLRVESINDLAQKVKRNVKNVYEDLKVLNMFGFVKLNKRKKRALIPETLVKEITFIVRLAWPLIYRG